MVPRPGFRVCMHHQLFSFKIIIVHLHAYDCDITMTTVYVIYILLSNFMHLSDNSVDVVL